MLKATIVKKKETPTEYEVGGLYVNCDNVPLMCIQISNKHFTLISLKNGCVINNREFCSLDEVSKHYEKCHKPLLDELVLEYVK